MVTMKKYPSVFQGHLRESERIRRHILESRSRVRFLIQEERCWGEKMDLKFFPHQVRNAVI